MKSRNARSSPASWRSRARSGAADNRHPICPGCPNSSSRKPPAMLGPACLPLYASLPVKPHVCVFDRFWTELVRPEVGLEVGGGERLGIQKTLRLFALLVEQKRDLRRRFNAL